MELTGAQGTLAAAGLRVPPAPGPRQILSPPPEVL